VTALLTITYDWFKELEADKEVCYVFFNIENLLKNFASCTSTLLFSSGLEAQQDTIKPVSHDGSYSEIYFHLCINIIIVLFTCA